MGILDFLKKKTTNPNETTVPNEERVRPQYTQKTSTDSVVPIPDMIRFGLEWRDRYLSDYAIKKDNKVSAEALMYTCWSVWYHCLNNGRVSRDQSYSNNFFALLMAHLQDNDPRFEEVDFFMPLFKNRYQIYRTDIKGLVESHYPVTKQYIPMCTYKAFCVDQLKIVSPSSISSLSLEEDEEMMDFVGKFISFTNEMNRTIDKTF